MAFFKSVADATKFLATVDGFDRSLQKVKILCLNNGVMQAEMKVEKEHTNPWGLLHGAFSTLLFDTLSTIALMSTIPNDNVSIEMQLKFIKGAKIGDEIRIDTSVLKSGKYISFLEMEILNKKTGDLLVQGSQTKFLKQIKDDKKSKK